MIRQLATSVRGPWFSSRSTTRAADPGAGHRRSSALPRPVGADDPHAAALAWMTERTARPIDPFSDRLAEMTLIRLCDDLHYLHYFAHHIVMDGSAAQVLTDRISEVYGALVEGVAPPPTSTAPVEEVWRSVVAYNGSTREASDREYWRERLLDLPPSVSIADRPGPVTTPALRSPGELPAGTLTGSGSGSTMPDVPVIVAGFAAYLSRVLGVGDIVLSLPVSARTTACCVDRRVRCRTSYR
ncbi:hypothetical protein GS415_06585 [Rhodococcus hoagii]|nr:hypothetical protein [Prescottella equi]